MLPAAHSRCIGELQGETQCERLTWNEARVNKAHTAKREGEGRHSGKRNNSNSTDCEHSVRKTGQSLGGWQDMH